MDDMCEPTGASAAALEAHARDAHYRRHRRHSDIPHEADLGLETGPAPSSHAHSTAASGVFEVLPRLRPHLNLNHQLAMSMQDQADRAFMMAWEAFVRHTIIDPIVRDPRVAQHEMGGSEGGQRRTC